MSNFPETDQQNLVDASFSRRLAAMFYDFCLIIAIWMVSTMVIVYAISGGEAVSGFLFQLFLYLEIFFFYLLFWRIKGQSLGMQVWKIRLLSDTGQQVSYAAACIRFLVATVSLSCFGLGFIWMLWDKQGLTWQDRASRTRIVFLGKDAYKSA